MRHRKGEIFTKSMRLQATSRRIYKQIHAKNTMQAGDCIPLPIQSSSEQLPALKPMRDLVEYLLKEQSMAVEVLFGNQVYGNTFPENANCSRQCLVEEEGPYGIEITSQRLTDYARSLLKADQHSLEIIKCYIWDGFFSVQKKLRGELPKISNLTVQRTIEKLDALYH